MAASGRLIIAGERYSPNLGDGIIAETMAYLFRRVFPNSRVDLLDISGRRSWQAPHNGRVSTKIRKGFQWLLPPRWYHLLRWHLLQKGPSLDYWRKELDGVTTLVVGGGQLIMDNYLEFPLKIRALTTLAAEQGVEVHVSACGTGTGRPWSRYGTELLRASLSEARTITLRDELSRQNVAIKLNISPTEVTFDPAIWTAEVYGKSASPSDDALVGLGVLDVGRINANNPYTQPLTAQRLIHFWVEVIRGLDQAGRNFEVFSNGGQADQAFAGELARVVEAELGMRCPVARRPATPEALAHTICRYSAVVASRLHANIIATSYGIPTVGLVWDEKVRLFYQETGRETFYQSIHLCDASALLQRLANAEQRGIDVAALKDWKEKALRNAFIVAECSELLPIRTPVVR